MGIGNQELSELTMWNSIDFPVGFLGKPIGSDIESFNSDVSIIVLGKFDNLGSDLTASCLHEIGLLPAHSSQRLSCLMRTFIGKAFQFSSPYIESSLLVGNILPEIQLLDNSMFLAIENCCRSKRFRADVKTDNNRLVNRFDNRLFKDNDYSSICEKGDIGELPFFSEKPIESFKSIIYSYGDCEGLALRIGNLETWISTIGFNESKPSLVEPNRNSINIDSIESIPLQNLLKFPSVFSCFLNNITWQEGGLPYA